MVLTQRNNMTPKYSASQKSRNPKFKGKYFVSVIGKFQFAVPSGNTGLLSPQQVCGFSRFLRIRCSLVNCFDSVLNSAACVYCKTLISNAVVWSSWTDVSDALSECYCTKQVAKINDATLRRGSLSMLKLAELCLQQGGGHFQHML
jgi:hypothetical protein